MKKIFSVLLILTLSIGLIGCLGNTPNSNDKSRNESNYSEDIEKGKEALANKNYDEALELFDIALSKNKSNNETTILLSIVDKYLRAKKAVVHNNFEEAKTILDSLNNEYKQYAIKTDIETLKNEVDRKLSEIKTSNTTTESNDSKNIKENSTKDTPTKSNKIIKSTKFKMNTKNSSTSRNITESKKVQSNSNNINHSKEVKSQEKKENINQPNSSDIKHPKEVTAQEKKENLTQSKDIH